MPVNNTNQNRNIDEDTQKLGKIKFDEIVRRLADAEDMLASHRHTGRDMTQELQDGVIRKMRLLNELKLGDGVNESGKLVLELAPEKGDVFIKSASMSDGDFDNSDGNNGFIIGIDDSDGDKVKFFFGGSDDFISWDGTNLSLRDTDLFVATSGNIQNAIDTVANKGGGVVRLASGTFNLTSDVNLKGNVKLVGAGSDATILDFGGNAAGIVFKGSNGSVLDSSGMSDFKVQNSNNTAGIDIDFADNWNIKNVTVNSCDQKGIRVQNSQSFTIDMVKSTNNTGNGIEIVSDNSGTNRICHLFNIVSCESNSNGSAGFSFDYSSTTGATPQFSLYSCSADSNTDDGFQTNSGTSESVNCTISGFLANNNGGVGIQMNAPQGKFVNCTSKNNTSFGIESTGTNNVFVGCISNSNDRFDWSISQGGAFVGCDFNSSASIDSHEFNSYQSIGNLNQIPLLYRVQKIYTNDSGSQITEGNVVVYAPTSTNRNDVSTTTTQGDDKVVGVVSGANVPDGASFELLEEGFINLLKVDGTTDIAIGDFLATFTTAGIAAKAGSGDMAFAIALEAYTTDDSNGIIEAYIIKPRKI